MKIHKLLILLLAVLYLNLVKGESATLTEIPANVFVENGKTDFDILWLSDCDIKSEVEKIFNTPNLLFHQGAKTESPSNSFLTYWEKQKDNWKAIRFQKNGELSLIFTGKTFEYDIKENIEIYHQNEKTFKLVWSENGRLVAYHIHPYTKEILLFQHKYPCCQSSSHNLFRIRLINNEIISNNRFFVGRDTGDMVGPFFPEKAVHDRTFHELKEITTLRWSPAKIDSNAFVNRSESNEIIRYNKGASYKILARQNNWLFVLMFSGIMEGPSAVMNYMNFINVPVYGWIKTE